MKNSFTMIKGFINRIIIIFNLKKKSYAEKRYAHKEVVRRLRKNCKYLSII